MLAQAQPRHQVRHQQARLQPKAGNRWRHRSGNNNGAGEWKEYPIAGGPRAPSVRTVPMTRPSRPRERCRSLNNRSKSKLFLLQCTLHGQDAHVTRKVHKPNWHATHSPLLRVKMCRGERRIYPCSRTIDPTVGDFFSKPALHWGRQVLRAAPELPQKTSPQTLDADPQLRVAIVADPTDPVVRSAPLQRAIAQLVESLAARGFVGEIHTRLDDVEEGIHSILVSSAGTPRAPC